MAVRERVVAIGKPVPLIGVVSEPKVLDPEKPALLLLNSGVIHHIGSCRLSVKLGRAAAEKAGLLALRFDFSGIGDSQSRRGQHSFGQAAVAEIKEVMDYLQSSRGIRHFVLQGLCSGGHAAYYTALVDSRVVGIAQIDGYVYRTWKSYWYHYRARLWSVDAWINAIRVRLLPQKKSGAEVAGIEKAYFEIPAFDERPPREQVAAGLRQLVERGVGIHAIFVCHDLDYNYQGQYRDCFSDVSFGDLLQVDYLAGASHILSEPDAQSAVINSTLKWLTKFQFS